MIQVCKVKQDQTLEVLKEMAPPGWELKEGEPQRKEFFISELPLAAKETLQIWLCYGGGHRKDEHGPPNFEVLADSEIEILIKRAI